MNHLDFDNLRFREIDSFTDIDLAKPTSAKLLADGSTISAKITDGQPTEYAVTGADGKLLNALYLRVHSDEIAARKCQVCFTTESGSYGCVNILCNRGVVVQTASE